MRPLYNDQCSAVDIRSTEKVKQTSATTMDSANGVVSAISFLWCALCGHEAGGRAKAVVSSVLLTAGGGGGKW